MSRDALHVTSEAHANALALNDLYQCLSRSQHQPLLPHHRRWDVLEIINGSTNNIISPMNYSYTCSENLDGPKDCMHVEWTEGGSGENTRHVLIFRKSAGDHEETWVEVFFFTLVWVHPWCQPAAPALPSRFFCSEHWVCQQRDKLDRCLFLPSSLSLSPCLSLSLHMRGVIKIARSIRNRMGYFHAATGPQAKLTFNILVI
ncbi:hypothetical protein J4Q44_G00103010 [Coregonus suidteri]|uniref:Uncharacterized protein n=1 Tax=Coregonus suidteri TaxID=861788 RepID=A0AAN8M703_9TELE